VQEISYQPVSTLPVDSLSAFQLSRASPWLKSEGRRPERAEMLGAYVHFHGGAWDGADAENLQGGSGRGLLALFYGAAFTG
jgi:hypothetical protein